MGRQPRSNLERWETACCLVMTVVLSSPALALDLNSFRAEHKLPPLSYSATLAGAAYSHAHDMARRNHLDHNGFKERAPGFLNS